MKKKVAFCLSGEMRWVQEGYNQHKRWFDLNKHEYDIDVFIHSWDVSGATGQLVNGCYPWKGTHPPKELTLNLYTPVSYLIEPQISFDVSRNFHGPFVVNLHNTKSMFYGIERVNKLRKEYEEKQGLKYDLVVRARYDVILRTPLSFSNFDTESVHLHCRPKHTPTSTSDLLAFGPGELMDQYSDTFNHLDRYNCDEGVFCCGEIILGHALYNDKKIKISEHDWTGNIEILRQEVIHTLPSS